MKELNDFGVVPVVVIESVEHALPLADALLAGGLPVVEITFRTSVAADVIRRLKAERPGLLVGAGTLLTEASVRAAKSAGAMFALAPGFNPQVVQAARQLGLPFIPGVATPSEVENAQASGCQVLKFFPAEMMGGVKMLQALAGPYGQTGVKFVPTGGVTPANLESYLRCPIVGAVGGTWIAKQEDLAAGRWDEIKERCRAAVEVVRRVRESA